MCVLTGWPLLDLHTQRPPPSPPPPMLGGRPDFRPTNPTRPPRTQPRMRSACCSGRARQPPTRSRPTHSACRLNGSPGRRPGRPTWSLQSSTPAGAYTLRAVPTQRPTLPWHGPLGARCRRRSNRCEHGTYHRHRHPRHPAVPQPIQPWRRLPTCPYPVDLHSSGLLSGTSSTPTMSPYSMLPADQPAENQKG
jgi:hypothetical protein